MNNKHGILFSAIIFIFVLFAKNAEAQSYINFSKFAGGSAVDSSTKMEVVAGETYLLVNTTSADLPVTDGSTYKGKKDFVLTKYSTTGTVIYAKYFGGNEDEVANVMKIVNGEVYIAGITSSVNYPVTNGSVNKGERDIFITKINTTGGIAFSTYIGGSKDDYLFDSELQIIGNEIFLAGTTTSSDFPATGGSVYKGGARDAFILKLQATTGSIIAASFIGGSDADEVTGGMYVENGAIFLTIRTASADIPTTFGSYLPGSGLNCCVYKLQGSNLQTIYARYLGGTAGDFLVNTKVLNGEVHVSGYTNSVDYPVTNGSTASGMENDGLDAVYTRLNSDGSIGFSTYLSTAALDILTYMQLSDDGDAYLGGVSISTANSQSNFSIYRIKNNGTIVYSKQIPIGLAAFIFPSFNIVNGALYLSGVTNAPNFPVTNGSQFHNGGTGFFMKLSPVGDIVHSAFLGKMNSALPMLFSNNKFYILGNTDFTSYQVNDSSKVIGGTDHLLVILNPDGSNFHSRYIGGSSNDLALVMQVQNDDVYFCGKTNSVNYPVTDPVLYKGNGDAFLTKLSFCPFNYDISDDTLSPSNQTTCKYGLAKEITGKRILVPGSNLPAIYLNGSVSLQKPVESTYQWQVASSPSGPWTNIIDATLKDYTPVVGGADQYYRRLSFTSQQCGSTLVHTSETAAVLVNNLTAPTVDAGGPFITCPGSPITLGGTPTASGGNTPYTSYIWDRGAAAIANPIVSPGVSTIYTVVVTDAMGCQQKGQAVVLSYAADAGKDKSNCANTPVMIGSPAIPGATGIQYSWLPNINISNPAIAQPTVNPSIPTDYELILTITKSGGGTCITKDTVKVLPVAAPVTTDMAGPDRTFCLGSTTTIGTPAEAGYKYTWSPGSYLFDNTSSVTTYSPGNINMPEPNPSVINLTAQKDGCSFTDQTIVSVIESRAGIQGCGPRLVGLPDRTPNIQENYQWIKMSGPGTFTGATNLPQVPVSASVGGDTEYGLIVSYQGSFCFSQVRVPQGCDGCQIIIEIDAKYKCPGFDANNGDVTLTAMSSIGEASYAWSPQIGLSSYTGNRVKLTDNVSRTYTVTATSLYDPSIFCAAEVVVNNPAFSAPVFPAPDVNACANVPVQIGLPPVAGYSYVWEGNGLINNFVSNPVAIIASQVSYPVKITDLNGCQLNDTVTVLIQNVNVDAGPDWTICSNGVATLGTMAQPNTTYRWEPSASPWQNGTDQFSAQPQVLALTDITFQVTATTSAGCISTDIVNIVINNSPTIEDAPDVILCSGKSITIGSPALPGVVYQWTPATGLSNPNIAQPQASPLGNTTYHLLATFPGACALPATDEVFVKVSHPEFTMPDINFCPGSGPISLGAAAPQNMTSYYWSPAAFVTNPFIANPQTLNPPPTVITEFALTVVNADGCVAYDTLNIIPVLIKPEAGEDKTLCKNASVTLGSANNSPAANVSYSWSPATNLSNPASGSTTFTATTGGIYQYILTKTDNNINCSSKDTVIIKVIDSLLPVINGPTICQNSCVQIGTNPVAGIQYQWTPATGLSNANIANPMACPGTITSQYVLKATDVNGCSSSATIVVGVNAVPAAQVTIPTVIACVGDNKTFNPVIDPAGDFSYLWTPNDGTLSSTTVLSPSIFITSTGNKQYTLQITDNVTGCTNSAVANLVVNTCSASGAVGDYVWFDTNPDGIQNPAELGVSGMNVKLYNNAGFNVASTFTDANGFYSFTNITAGNDYYIVFVKPTGYSFTTQHVGGIAALNNSKADVTGRTSNFNVAGNSTNYNLDAGIIPAGPTPVTLLTFTGELRNKEVFLNWQTTAEQNNAYFNVEKSTDRTVFTSIGRVQGNGTTPLPHNYSFIDKQPFTGINYYRLKQVDFDGRYNHSSVVAIKVSNSEVLKAYYNNQNNTIQITFSKKQKETQIKLYAANGQMIRSVTATGITGYTLELPDMATGIYMLQVANNIYNETQKIFIRK